MADRDVNATDETATVIRPPNKIKNKVAGAKPVAGDGFDPEMLKRAEEAAEAYSDVFIQELDKDMERLTAAFRELTTNPNARTDSLKAIQQAAHEIKGYGSSIGFPLLTKFADSLSLILRKSTLNDDEKVPVSQVHVDAMTLVFKQQLKDDGGEIGKQLEEGLRATLAKFVKVP